MLFYRGYKYHFIALLLILFFIFGFYVQNRLLKSSFGKIENININLYSHLLDNQFYKLECPTENPTEELNIHACVSLVDSIVYQRLVAVDSTICMPYVIMDDKKEVIVTHHVSSKKTLSNIDKDPSFHKVAQIQLPTGASILVYFKPNSFITNTTTYYLFWGIWIFLCLIIISLVVYAFERQKKAQKIRMDVLGNLSHEFKTPLTSIQLISELMIQKGCNLTEKKISEYALIIHQESDKMLTLANQLLSSGYIDNFKIPVRMKEFSIHGLINFAVSSYEQIYKSQITITKDFQASHDVTYVDRTHFVNVITNLLDNAKKYSGSSAAEVHFHTHEQKNKLILEISDKGIGIEHKFLKLIFERFYRVPKGNIHEKSGYGIGLFYVKTILRRMKADIRATSIPGTGTTFILTFQLKNNRKTP